jgi:hypothetical protein
VGFRILVCGVLGLCVAAALAQEAHAQEAHVYVYGTDGLAPVPFEVANQGSAGLVCGAAIAHWYSEVVGKAEPGGTLSAGLWSDPRDGAVYLINPARARMPVEALWCGIEGRDVSTRSVVALVRRAGAPEPPVRLACRNAPAGDRLDCRRGGTD